MLADEGIEVVFGHVLKAGRMDGLVAKPGGWRTVSDHPVDAIHDRFPSQIRSEAFQQILDGARGMMMANSLDFTMLCRDKVLFQQTMVQAGLDMPAMETDPAHFQARLEQWGAGFIKPRFGALGTGVSRVVSSDDLPEVLPGVVPGRLEPAILQRAVMPPAGYAGRAVRVLVQRTPEGWHQCPAVVRSSPTDPVANAARGAQVGPGSALLERHTLASIAAACRRTTDTIDGLAQGRWAVEAGIDLVLDAHNQPHLIELNSRPRGRLEVLAAQDPDAFGQAHVQAVARPIRMLAHWAAG